MNVDRITEALGVEKPASSIKGTSALKRHERIIIIEEIKDSLISLHALKNTVQQQLKNGIINIVDAANEIDMIISKERKLKEQLVMKVHVTRTNEPRKIEYKEKTGLWKTLLPDKTAITGKSKEIIIDKLLQYYEVSIVPTDFESVFLRALKEKEESDNVKSNTISRYKQIFSEFVSGSLAKMDIKEISKTDLKKYTLSMVIKHNPTKKAFLSYKSVLNLAFRYAMENELITSNPVVAIHNNRYYKSCRTEPHKPEEKILSEAEIKLVNKEVRKRMQYKKYNGYFINGYAILLSIETGLRVAEICSLKWEDINYEDEYIHIHSQQLCEPHEGGKRYYYAEYTKDEKGISNGGCQFPLTDTIKSLLGELKALEDAKNIKSEYIFCHEDGEWIKKDAYETCLRRMLQRLGFSVTNNHAFRMSLNSNILIPLGIPVTERARMLGHSVETNLRYYSFAGKDSNSDILNKMNLLSPRSHQKQGF